MIRRCPGWIEGVHPTINGETMPRYLGQKGIGDPNYKEHKHEETTVMCDDCLKAFRESEPGIVRDRSVGEAVLELP